MAYTDEFTGSRFLEFHYGSPDENNKLYREGLISTKWVMPGTEEEIIVLIPHQKIYTPPIRNRPVSSILYFRAGVTGTIREVAIYPGGSTTFGNWYFNVRLNGDPLFSGSNRPKVNGTNPIIKGGLNVPCTQGDTIVLDLEQAGSGSIAGPTTFIVTIESAG